MDSQVDASHKNALSVQPCACTHTSENNTDSNLCQLALGGQTVKNLCQLVCEFELVQK